MRALLACGLLAGTAVAQTTWIVDQAGGTGTHFTDLAPALAVARHGDTILVRPGLYGGGTTSQGITILALPGALLDRTRPGLRVAGLPAGRSFVLEGLGATSNAGGLLGPPLWLDSNAGPIHLESLTLTGLSSYFWLNLEAVRIEACAAVTVAACTLTGGPAVRCTSSVVALSGCRLVGKDAYPFNEVTYSPRPALQADFTTVTLAHSTLSGGNGTNDWFGNPVPGAPAALLTSCATTITGDASSVLQAGKVPSRPTVGTVAVQAPASTLLLSPLVTLTPSGGAPAIGGPPAQSVTRHVPALLVAGAPPGGTLTTDLLAQAGDQALLGASALTTPRPHPFGSAWLDPANLVLLDFGAVGSSGHRLGSFPVPGDPRLFGLPLLLQAVTLDAAGALALSTPAATILD